MVKITIEVESISMEAELLDTPTARKIGEVLPLEGFVNVFGRVLDNPQLFKSVPNEATIRITAAAA